MKSYLLVVPLESQRSSSLSKISSTERSQTEALTQMRLSLTVPPFRVESSVESNPKLLTIFS